MTHLPACTSAPSPPAPPGLPEHLEAALWRGDQLGRSPAPTCASGFAALDAELPGGGWPTAALTELLLAAPGQGELRLLGPACAAMAGRPLLWIAPPHRPYTPALSGLGLQPGQLVWIDPADAADAAWAAEQAVKSRSCAAVLWWAPQARADSLRRLHLAAQGSDGLLFVLRPLQAATRSSPAPLRLSLQAEVQQPGRLSVHILKRRGPARDVPLSLDTQALFAPALVQRLARALPHGTAPMRVPGPRPVAATALGSTIVTAPGTLPTMAAGPARTTPPALA